MRVSGLELAQHNDSAGTLVLVQNHQLNSFIRAGYQALSCKGHFASANRAPLRR